MVIQIIKLCKFLFWRGRKELIKSIVFHTLKTIVKKKKDKNVCLNL